MVKGFRCSVDGDYLPKTLTFFQFQSLQQKNKQKLLSFSTKKMAGKITSTKFRLRIRSLLVNMAISP